ncbi:MAG: sulfate/molybdate ABC transporter ATP-binding protein [Actinomycetes bacterium]
MSLHADVDVRRNDFHLAVSLQCDDAETVAVIGPNGAGKTTLLRALAGLEPLTAGRVTIDRTVLEDTTEQVRTCARQRRAGVVFQEPRLFPHLSARDNVAFGPRSRRMRRAEADRLAERTLRELDLGGLSDRLPHELSGGQSQRVALARALATAPDYLLLDEPLSALDAQTRSVVRHWLQAVIDRYRGPCLLVTHDPVEALTLADRIVVLIDGRISQSGPPSEIARHPTTTYAARMFGLNLYRGRLSAGSFAVDGGGQLSCADVRSSADAVATVRPSAVTLYAEPPPRTSARNIWAGRVSAVEVLGERARVELDGPPPVIAEVTAASLAELRLHPGAQVWASVKATDIDLSH